MATTMCKVTKRVCCSAVYQPNMSYRCFMYAASGTTSCKYTTRQTSSSSAQRICWGCFPSCLDTEVGRAAQPIIRSPVLYACSSKATLLHFRTLSSCEVNNVACTRHTSCLCNSSSTTEWKRSHITCIAEAVMGAMLDIGRQDGQWRSTGEGKLWQKTALLCIDSSYLVIRHCHATGQMLRL